MALVFFHLLDLEALAAQTIGRNEPKIRESAIQELKLLYLSCGLEDTIVVPPGCLLESKLARDVVFEAKDLLDSGEIGLIYAERDLQDYRDARLYTYRNVIHIPPYRDAYKDRRALAHVASIPRRIAKPSSVDRTLTRGLRERVDKGYSIGFSRRSAVHELVLWLEEMSDRATVWPAVEQLEQKVKLTLHQSERTLLRRLLFDEYVLAYSDLGLRIVESREFVGPQLEGPTPSAAWRRHMLGAGIGAIYGSTQSNVIESNRWQDIQIALPETDNERVAALFPPKEESSRLLAFKSINLYRWAQCFEVLGILERLTNETFRALRRLKHSAEFIDMVGDVRAIVEGERKLDTALRSLLATGMITRKAKAVVAALDQTSNRKSGYAVLDRVIADIESQIRAEAPDLGDPHLRDFVDVLYAIGNFAAASLQQGLFKAQMTIDEAVFQSALLLHLRSRLGERVTESPREGAGVPDIICGSVTCELKVERYVSERRKMIDKYIQQATQYTSAHGARLGVLCVLDVTEKIIPPAGPANQFFLEKPALHGFSLIPPPYAVYVAVIVIDGSLVRPSSYSR